MLEDLGATLSETEAAWISLTVISLSLWIWDAVSALREWRAQPKGDVLREVAAYILTLRLGWTAIQFAALLAGLAAASVPPPSGVGGLTATLRNVTAILTQVGSICVALWGRTLRARAGDGQRSGV